MASRHTHRGGGTSGVVRPRLIRDPVQLSLAVERSDINALKNVASERGIPLSQLVRETLRAKTRGES